MRARSAANVSEKDLEDAIKEFVPETHRSQSSMCQDGVPESRESQHKMN